jgi:hypothetical protein
MAKKKTYELKGDITFKQSWTIAHQYADENILLYPEHNLDSLAKLFNGAIFYYHESLGQKLSKAEASEIISEKISCPKHYLDEINNFLSKNKKSKKKSKALSKKEDVKDERALSNMELAILKSKSRIAR